VRFLRAGMELQEHPYVMHLLELYIGDLLEKLQKKWRIPLRNSRYLRAIPDIWEVLGPNEIFVPISGRSEDPVALQQNAVVYRNPGLEMSDVQSVKCRDVSHKVPDYVQNVVVCSTHQSQDRSILSKLSNGDYDGDQILVCYGPDFQDVKCEDYVPRDISDIAKPTHDLGLVKDQGIEESLHQMKKKLRVFFKSAHLRDLSVAWKKVADIQGASSPRCREIAAMHAVAVDSFSTGIMVDDGKYRAAKRMHDIQKDEDSEETIAEKITAALKEALDTKNKQRANMTFTHDQQLLALYEEYVPKDGPAAGNNKRKRDGDTNLISQVQKFIKCELVSYNLNIQKIFRTSESKYIRFSLRSLAKMESNKMFMSLILGIRDKCAQFLKDNKVTKSLDIMHWRNVMAVVAYYETVTRKEKKEASLNKLKERSSFKFNNQNRYKYGSGGGGASKGESSDSTKTSNDNGDDHYHYGLSFVYQIFEKELCHVKSCTAIPE